MKCPNCGKEIADDSVFCEYCGTRVQNQVVNTEVEDSEVEASFGQKLISFLIPFVGLIIYGINNKRKPKIAKGCLNAAIWGVVVQILLYILPMFMY